MKINIGNHDFSIVWDGVYYKALSNYPRLSDWEIKNIVEFINYEEEHGREVIIESENEELLKEVHEKIKSPDDYKFAKKPELLTECTACNQGGCLTKYLCHVASLDNAKKIISSGKLLSALEVRNVSVDVLVNEDRNAAKDPADYFDYIMFSWGNCQAGDRLVMERKNNRPPTEDDLSVDFTPGVRFYFDYDVLKNNPNSKSDGYHALKIKKELSIIDNVKAIIIPSEYCDEFNDAIPNDLLNKVHYIKNDCKNIWDWSEKVYEYVDNNHNDY